MTLSNRFNSKIKVFSSLALVGGVSLLSSAVSQAQAPPPSPGINTFSIVDPALKRISAMYTATDQAILLPKSAPATGLSPGIQIYNQTFTIPNWINVMYVTIEGTAIIWSLAGDDLALLCQVDGKNCLVGSGSQGIASVTDIPPGWVLPLGSEFSGGNLGATGFTRSWCVLVLPGQRTVTLTGASAVGNANIYLEAVQVTVDVNGISNPSQACGSYPTPNPVTSPD